MPDAMIGFRAHENDLELIEFVAGELEKIEAMLPVQIRSRGLSRQDVLRAYERLIRMDRTSDLYQRLRPDKTCG